MAKYIIQLESCYYTKPLVEKTERWGKLPGWQKRLSRWEEVAMIVYWPGAYWEG